MDKYFQEIQQHSKNSTVQKAALLLRESIVEAIEHAPTVPWPPTVDSLNTSGTIYPDILRMFLTTVLSTKNSHNVTRNKVERLVESFGQNLMFAVSNGKFITPKHAAVGLGLHSLTGQKLPIKVLSRLGHSIAYDTVNEIETAQAELVQHFNALNFNLPLEPVAEGCKVSISSNFVSCSQAFVQCCLGLVFIHIVTHRRCPCGLIVGGQRWTKSFCVSEIIFSINDPR